MNCKRIEKPLFLLSDGHADAEQERRAREHLRSCARCGRLFVYLQSMRRECAFSPTVEAIPQSETSIMVADALRQRRHIRERRAPWFNALQNPKIAVPFATLIITAAGMILYPVLRQAGRPPHPSLHPIPAQVNAPKCDTTLARPCTTSTVRRSDETTGRVPSTDSAALHQYAIARSMVLKEKFAIAAHVLEDYLTKYTFHADSAWFDLGYCYTMLHRHRDAVAAYRHVATASVDGPLMETALHRANKILYLKLALYDEARSGIDDYLSKYPHGKWREEEWYFRVKTALAEKNFGEADSLVKRYRAEFPLTCNARELTSSITTMKHGATSRK